MSFPINLNFGSVSISLHLIFEVLGFIIGFRFYKFLKKRQKDTISSENRIWILVGAAVGALIFSRLIGALENPKLFFSGEQGLLYYYENKTIIGGLLGGVLGVELAKKVIGEKHSSGDLFTYPLILAIILGRIGCFSMGVYENTFGNVTTSIFGLDLGDGVLRHPTALYEIVILLLIWFSIYFINKRRQFDAGAKFKFFIICYLSYRFCIEFIRPGEVIVINLNVIQLSCLVGLFYYYNYIIQPSRLLAHAQRK